MMLLLSCTIYFYIFVIVASLNSRRVGDGVVLSRQVVFYNGSGEAKVNFRLWYSELRQWEKKCNELAATIGLEDSLVMGALQPLLDGLRIPEQLLKDDPRDHGWTSGRLSSRHAADILRRSARYSSIRVSPRLLFRNDPAPGTGTRTAVFWPDQQALYPEVHSLGSWLPSYLQRDDAHSSSATGGLPVAQIVLYQTIGANTGGTTAMWTLHRTLLDLGYDAIICNATNRYEPQCTRPADHQLIITGEWCHEVYAEYALNPSPDAPHTDPDSPEGRLAMHQRGSFAGRGVQYYLGFHHAQDSCRGSVALTDCHYLAKALTSRHLAGYYLGCTMSDPIWDTVHDLLPVASSRRKANEPQLADKADLRTEIGTSNEAILVTDGTAVQSSDDDVVPVWKEDLIIVDPDFFHDYPPFPALPDLRLPSGYKYVYAKGIPAAEMPMLLQRAKIVLDLGMPGPERLSTECILLGCIPIVSSRWVGASRVDFPGIRRVDHQNVTDIEAALSHVAAHYEEELQSEGNRLFYEYALSMWERAHHTADIVLGSSYLHFVLVASNLQEEYTALFQLLSLLYLFPLCSVDIYVTDVMWYFRHHYAAIELLQQAGYIRNDPLDPREWADWARDPAQSTSFVRFRHLHELGSERGSGGGQDGFLRPKWAALTVVVTKGKTFAHSYALLDHLTSLVVGGQRTFCSSEWSLHAANMTICDAVAVALGPGASDSLVREAIQALVAPAREIRSNLAEAVAVPLVDVISVCDLVTGTNQQAASDRQDQRIAAGAATGWGVRESAAWQSLRGLFGSLDYSC